MEETLKRRVKTRFIYFDPEDERSLMSGQEEETWEPLDSGSEFQGDDLTLSLPHGQVPPNDGVYRIFKVYEKSTIWIRHAPKEASL